MDTEFYNAFIDFCKYFSKYKDLSTITGSNVAGYKTSRIKSNSNFRSAIYRANNNFEFYISDLLITMYNLFLVFDKIDFDSDKISEEYDNLTPILQLLHTCCHDYTKIQNKTLSDVQKNKLLAIKEKFIRHFDTDFFDDFQSSQTTRLSTSMNNAKQKNTDQNNLNLSCIKNLISDEIKNHFESLKIKTSSQPSTNTVQNENENESQKNQVPIYEKRIKHCLMKKLKAENHIKIIEGHETLPKTVPESMRYYHFPKPFFPHHKKFVEGYNKIIEETQTKIHQYIKEIINEDIQSYMKEIDEIKIKLVQDSLYNNDNIDEYVNNLQKDEEVELTKTFYDSDKKLKECKLLNYSTEYKAIEFVTKNTTSTPKTAKKTKKTPRKSISINEDSSQIQQNKKYKPNETPKSILVNKNNTNNNSIISLSSQEEYQSKNESNRSKYKTYNHHRNSNYQQQNYNNKPTNRHGNRQQLQHNTQSNQSGNHNHTYQNRNNNYYGQDYKHSLPFERESQNKSFNRNKNYHSKKLDTNQDSVNDEKNINRQPRKNFHHDRNQHRPYRNMN